MALSSRVLTSICAGARELVSVTNVSLVCQGSCSGQSSRGLRQIVRTNNQASLSSSTNHGTNCCRLLISSSVPASSLPAGYLHISRKMSAVATQDFLFRQLFDFKSYTYTYLVADKESKEAIIIDPVLEMVDRDIQISRDLGLNLKFGVNTHMHADHVTGTGEIRKRIPTFKSVIAKASGAEADLKITDGHILEFGKFKVTCLSTPGHTNGCMTYVWHEKGIVFTGDALLIRGCGRTDFQQGDAGMLFDMIHGKIFSLPDNFFLYPGHDYTGQTVTTVGEEKKLNQRLTRTRDEYIQLMKDLNLPYPKQIDRALPLNQVCGLQERVEVTK